MMSALPERKNIGATEARQKLGRLLNSVHKGEEHLVVEKLGIPVAAVISIQDYEHYRRLLAKEALQDLGHRMGKEIERQGLTEEELVEKLKEDRKEVYEKRYGQET